MPDVATEDRLSYRDTEELLERLGSLAEQVILVGGQAVHFWASHYEERLPPRFINGTFASKDVDFWGTRKHATDAASLLSGEVRMPTMDDATPNSGLVLFDFRGHRWPLDFLGQVFGLKLADVQEMSLVVTTASGAKFRVLPPLLCFESRVCNTALDGYRSEHAMRQLDVALECAKLFVQDATDPSDFLKLCKRVFRFARLSRHAKTLYDVDGVDAFDVIPSASEVKLGTRVDRFYEKRYPQMLEILEGDRTRRANDRETRRKQAQGKLERAKT